MRLGIVALSQSCRTALDEQDEKRLRDLLWRAVIEQLDSARNLKEVAVHHGPMDSARQRAEMRYANSLTGVRTAIGEIDKAH